MATPMTVSQVVSQCKKWKIPHEVYSDAVGRPGSFTPIGFIIHHTGGPFTESDSYLSFLFEVGRPSEGIPAQLCQFSGGPSGKIYIGKMARANHAGRGDWTTRELVGAEDYPGYSSEINPGSDDYGTGNALYYGLEINYPGTLKMRSAQYDSAVRLGAAIMDFHSWEALSSIGHREHSSRKWDPGQCPLDKFRRDVRDLLRAGPDGKEEEEMELNDKVRLSPSMKSEMGTSLDELTVGGLLGYSGAAGFSALAKKIKDGESSIDRNQALARLLIIARRDEARLIALESLVTQVVGNDPGNQLTPEQVKDIVETAIQDNVIQVDVSIEAAVAPEQEEDI